MKILMVCMGNICRSPLAEGLMRHHAERLGLNCEIDSAGTSGYHAGQGPDLRSVAIAKRHGLDISEQRARGVELADFDKYDKIYVMDSDNYQNLKRMAPDKMDKVDFVRNAAHPNKNLAVPDPYYGGAEGFKYVYDMLDEACAAIAQAIKNQ